MAAVIDAPNYPRVKREVAKILAEFGIAEPPVNPVEIARTMGVRVFFAQFSGDALNVSGFYDCEEDAIYVNRDEYPLRQTFTVAHELGHRILHREWANSAEYAVLMRDALFAGDDPHEKEANAFAAHLLVPRALLDKYRRGSTVEQLSRLFAVSVPVINNRLALEYGI